MLYITFDADPELRMKLPRVATPQATLPEVGEQGDTVSHVKLHIERQRTAVDEGVPVMERGAVMQHFLAPIHRLISGESRSPRIDEHDFTGIGKYLEIVAALRRELRHRYGGVLVGVLFQEILPSEHPFVPLLRVGGESRPEAVPPVVAAGLEAVRHVRLDFDALHLRQASLGVRLPCEQGKRRYDYCDVLSHGQRTWSSLMVLARTKSSFSITKDWWRPPFFSFSSTTRHLPSGMVNFAIVKTVRSLFLPGTSVA